MAHETHELFASTARVIGRESMARALHVGVKQTYVLTADPMTVEVPCRNDADRMTNLFETLATYSNGKPTLIMWRLYFDDLFGRLLDHVTPRKLTAETIITEASEICAEVGDVLRECKPGFLPHRLAEQCAEAIARLERLAAMAEASDDAPAVRMIRRVQS